MNVIKKDGLTESWNNEKIINAIIKASDRINYSITENQCLQVAERCKQKVINDTKTSKLHSIVIDTLKELGFNSIADAYQEYRDYKNSYAKSWETLKNDADTIIFLGDRENANFDSSLISTKGSLIKGSLTKELYQQFYLSKTEKFLTKRGDIYIHDLRDMIFGSVNCCLFDIGNVLKNGFTMSGVKYSEPKTVLSALQVIGDITLVATAQQFGGFTLSEIDKVLLPYVYKSFNLHCNKFAELTTDNEKIEEFAVKETIREIEQGFQSLELKLNTVPCSRGDFAFTTLTFGQWDINLENKDKYWLKTIGETILNTRKKGHNGFMVVFPKLVYLYDKEQVENDSYSAELFDKAVETSSTCMYPDYLSLSGSLDNNKVAQEYKEYKTIISPMGCIDYHERVNITRCDKYDYNIKIGDLFNHYFNKKGNSSNYLETKFNFTLKSKKVLNEEQFKKNGYASFDGDLVNIWASNFIETVGRKPCRIDFEEYFGIPFPRRYVREDRGYNLKLFNIWDSYLELRVTDDLKYSGFTEKMYKKDCTSEKDFVRNSKFKVNDKTYEIDIFFPKLNYGIEIQDFATHSKNSDNEFSEKGYHKKGISYHNEKRNCAKKLGIEIVELWEDKIRSNDYSELKIKVNHKNYKVKHIIKSFSNNISDVLELENFNLKIQDIDGNKTKLKRIIRNKNIVEWLNITFENGNKIRVTEDHPFITENGQILANELKIGNYLLTENEEQILITQIEKDNIVGYSYDVQTESETFVFSGIASHNCRAYLSHWEDPETNKAITIGRCNIGAVSLNIPVIMAVAKQEYGYDWKSKFWSLLESRLQTIREFLKKRYEIIRNTKASTNPLAFTQGGFYKGNLKPDDKIGDLVKYMTASFGITALNESTILWNGKTVYEDKHQFANKVVDFIAEKVEKFKKEDGYLYALYGTPGESLCFSGDTIVQAYPENKRIDEIKEGDYVYSLNPDLKTRELKKVTFAGKTGTDRQVVKVTTDNGQEFICTPNHKFAIRNMLHDGNKFDGENIKWVEAKDLKAGDRLKSNYITISDSGHYKMHGVFVHDIIAETFLGKKKNGYCVHHKSLNKLDNNIENLEYLTETEHKSLHWKLNNPNKGQFVGESNNFFGKTHSKETLLKNRSEHMKGSVVAFNINNQIVYQYECAQDAEKDGFNASAIRRCCRGLYNDTCTYKGYTWSFYPYEQNHKVVSVEFLEDTYDVYDITVEDNHNFFVGGNEGVLVHNCSKQAQQYKNLTDDDQFGEYLSNSFHCHVSEHITPIEKQDAEFTSFHKINGGHIQYVRIDNPENLVALKTIIQRGMDMGFYQGVNFDSTKCNNCGQTSYNVRNKCPHCGSTDINTISRVCGYLGYSNINGQSRMNDGKMCEISDRVSM